MNCFYKVRPMNPHFPPFLFLEMRFLLKMKPRVGHTKNQFGGDHKAWLSKENPFNASTSWPVA